MEQDIKLTKLASCAGCGAKVGAGVLAQLLEGCGGRIAPGGDGGGPQSQRRQQQGQESAYMDLFHWYHLTDKPMR